MRRDKSVERASDVSGLGAILRAGRNNWQRGTETTARPLGPPVSAASPNALAANRIQQERVEQRD